MNKINLYIGNIYIKLISKFVNYYWDYYIIIVWILLIEYKVLLLLFVLFLICVYSYIWIYLSYFNNYNVLVYDKWWFLIILIND